MAMIARSVASTHWFHSSTIAARRPMNGTTTPIMFAVRSALDMAMQPGVQTRAFLEVWAVPGERKFVGIPQLSERYAPDVARKPKTTRDYLMWGLRYGLPLALFIIGWVI